MGNSNELLTLKRNALRLGLCGEYKGKWDSAASKRELVNMAQTELSLWLILLLSDGDCQKSTF